MSPELSLELQPLITTYGQGGDVEVRVLLFNFQNEPVWVNSRFALSDEGGPGEVSLEVVGPGGERVPFGARVNIGTPGEQDFSLVKPWNCVGRQLEVVPYFRLDEQGAYRIRAKYENRWTGKEYGLGAWTGTLNSEPLEIEIKGGNA